MASCCYTTKDGIAGFLGLIAELLGATVLYAMEGRVEFGDLYMAVTAQQKASIEKAVRAVRLWEQDEVVEALQAPDEPQKAARRISGPPRTMVAPPGRRWHTALVAMGRARGFHPGLWWGVLWDAR